MAIAMRDVAAALEMIGAPALDTLQLIDAAALAAQYYPLFDPSSPTLVLNLEGTGLGRIGQVLLQAYPGSHEVMLLPATQRRRSGSKTWRADGRDRALRPSRCPTPAHTRPCRTFRRGCARPTAARGTAS